MAKSMLVTLPFVLLLMDYWPLRRLRFGQEAGDNRLKAHGSFIPLHKRSVPLRLVLEKVPFIAIAGVSSAVTLFAQQHGGGCNVSGVITTQGPYRQCSGFLCKLYLENDLA